MTETMLANWMAYCQRTGIDIEIMSYCVWLTALPGNTLYEDLRGNWTIYLARTAHRYAVADLMAAHHQELEDRTWHTIAA